MVAAIALLAPWVLVVVGGAPAQAAPVPSAPVPAAPGLSGPVGSAPVGSAPVWPGPGQSGPVRATPAVRYRLPLVAPVVDPWRPPSGPYAAGNRGIDLGAAPGTLVQAAADGTVTFAGQVGGRRYVVVRHADGVRTTLGGLDGVWVRAGALVRGGQPVGTAGGPVHFGARVGTAYVDPLTLLGPVRVWLVPARDPTGTRWPT